MYAKVNDLGFIETPYRKVEDGKVNLNDDPVYLSAEQEEDLTIAQANAPINKDGSFKNDIVKTRLGHDYPVTEPENVGLMDVAPNQIALLQPSLIPFLEHDDANRAFNGI